MEREELIKRLLKLPNGDYYADVEKLMIPTEKKKNLIIDFTGDVIGIKLFPLLEAQVAFEEIKYGLEYATEGKIRYVHTNDLNTLMINK